MEQKCDLLWMKMQLHCFIHRKDDTIQKRNAQVQFTTMGQAVNVRSSKKIAKNNFDKERAKQVVADLRLFIQDVFSKGTYANRKANKLMGIKKDFQIFLINDIKIKEYKIENITKSLFFRRAYLQMKQNVIL